MGIPQITTANAKEFAAKSHESRRKRKEAEALAEAATLQTEPTSEPLAVNPLANEFTCAMVETLRQFREASDYREKASLARSMREVRETYHLWSGQPKPGTIKPERVSSRQQVKPVSEPKLDTPTGSGSQ